MGQILIHNVDDSVIAMLQRRAAALGHSLEDEARAVLQQAAKPSRADLVHRLRTIQAMTSPDPHRLAEDLIRESRDER